MTSSPDPRSSAWLPDLDDSAWARDAEPEGEWRPPSMDAGHAVLAHGGAHSRLEEAYERGYAVGTHEGFTRAARELVPVIAMLRGLCEEYAAARVHFEADRSRNLYGLALAVARQLLQREIHSDPGVVRDLVAQALDQLPPESMVDVRLNPVDLAALTGALEVLHAASRGLTLQWIAEPSLERGSFLLETPARIVDGRTDVALRTLYERLAHE